MSVSWTEAVVDFNATTADGSLGVSRAFVTGWEPKPGDLINLRDYDGNTCTGVVLAVTDRALRVRLVFESWQPSPHDASVGTAHSGSLERDLNARPSSGLRHNELMTA
jgi:hypothetical protein